MKNIERHLGWMTPTPQPNPKLTLRKLRTGTYVVWQVMNPDGIGVGEICRTGEARDNYPWSWHFYTGHGPDKRAQGVAGSRREALDTMTSRY